MIAALLLLQAATAQPQAAPPDIQLDINVTARRVVIENKGDLDLTIRTSVNGREADGGNLVEVEAPDLPQGRRQLDNVQVRVRAEARIADPLAAALNPPIPQEPGGGGGREAGESGMHAVIGLWVAPLRASRGRELGGSGGAWAAEGPTGRDGWVVRMKPAERCVARGQSGRPARSVPRGGAHCEVGGAALWRMRRRPAADARRHRPPPAARPNCCRAVHAIEAKWRRPLQIADMVADGQPRRVVDQGRAPIAALVVIDERVMGSSGARSGLIDIRLLPGPPWTTSRTVSPRPTTS